MKTNARKLAVVTAASGGIGLELARQCAQNNYDLIIAAHEPSILETAEELACSGISVSPVQCDLTTLQGVDALTSAITASGKPADILIANAGREFLGCNADECLVGARSYIDGTIYLVDQVSRSMRGRGQGRILITYSIAGLIPHTSQAAHDSNQVFLSFFSTALCRELRHTGVTVTCLTPRRSRSMLFDRAATGSYDKIIGIGTGLNGIGTGLHMGLPATAISSVT